MTPEEKYELFERKINGELSAKEEGRLLLIINNDKAIADEFRIYKEWSSYLGSNLNLMQEQSDLENNLKEIGNAFFTQKSGEKKAKIIKIPSWGYAVAASIAIILGVYIFTKSKPTYNDFVSIPELSIIERGVENEIINNAEEAFNSKNYDKAGKYLSELLKNDETNSVYLFYYGITLIEQNKSKEASQIFATLQKGSSAYKYRAIWFEALNQLKQDNKDQCIELLKTVPKEAEDYTQAQKLLKKL
ncbi:tol-pal system YbgF family protein [Aquimarina sp. RZ0]|uniref:tetratricopeptide repeat protein n=1 Tax=Aquimarina sp. RZ0 TaxID=2607730 RepID=UPI0011F0B83E|nr:hypothetical protein [Aquimarina sp. RZ0]KAA1247438.1 hypothetical protein F0000_02970 [Aquimarina sp. RZ0]